MENNYKTPGPNVYRNLSDHERIKLLLNGDEGAWDNLCVEIIAPMTKIRKYYEIFSRYSLSLDSVVGQVYLDLIKDDCRRLRNFRFEGTLEAWLFFQIKDSVKKILNQSIGKAQWVLSENELETSPIEYNEAPDDPIERRMNREEANQYLVQLWKENPMKAYVLLLRIQNGLSSREVGEILGESDDNINQILCRAKNGMRKIRKGNK